MVIPVYIIATGDPRSPYVAKLSALFDTGYFEVSVVQAKDGKGHDKERKAFLYALENAHELAPNDPCIIVKDYMFSNLSSNDMYHLIDNIVNNAEWDLCYLARYLDKCNGKIILNDVTTGGALVTTKSAEGDDAVMYSPKARDSLHSLLEKHKHDSMAELLHKQLVEGKLVGVAMSPPAIQYNPVFGDLIKTCECKTHEKKHDDDSSTSYTWIPLILLFFIIILVVVWFFYR